jgi:N6-L-threonylcarbamoyladenine synthase/protein kinase Bud32
MYEVGDMIAIEDSRVRPEFRPDEVPVTWRSGEPERERARAGDGGGPAGADDPDEEIRGAEARVSVGERVRKERVPKTYRHPALDGRLRRERTRSEARLTSDARRAGVPTPVVVDVDDREARLVFERVGADDLRADLSPAAVRAVGRHLGTLHDAGLVHGDPTPRNVRVGGADGRVYLIDFGLGYYTGHPEDHAMDLHVFEGALAGVADGVDRLQEAFEDAYAAGRSDDEGRRRTLDRLREIEGRGRYQ